MSGFVRHAHLARLQRDRFDLLVIGGGATGAGVALDAATRGLSVALVERHDFASGTSSRSTKLVHGGVRYLEAAITQLDRAQYRLVREALAERATLLAMAPHLVRPLRTVVPAYRWHEALIYRIGLWLYDRAAGERAIAPSRWLTRRAMLKAFPALRRQRLKGGVAYWDGQFDDARMCVTTLRTAAAAGACVANRVEVTGLLTEAGRLCGAHVRDRVDGRKFDLHARVVVNATGPGSDAVRRMENPAARPMLEPSRGTHLVLDRSWAPGHDGLLIPRTADGRVLFVLPWQDATLAGTTDVAAEPCAEPRPTVGEVTYLLEQLAQWLDPPPVRADIRARWAGLRPLIAADTGSTAQIVREHHIETGPHGLISIAGGKWTTFRRMAEETVDQVLQATPFTATRACRTQDWKLLGAEAWHADLAHELATRHGLDEDVATHLAHAYGSQAHAVLALSPDGRHARLVAGHPYLEAEVSWAVREEMALDVEDVLARRLRLAFLDDAATGRARARVRVLMDAALVGA